MFSTTKVLENSPKSLPSLVSNPGAVISTVIVLCVAFYYATSLEFATYAILIVAAAIVVLLYHVIEKLSGKITEEREKEPDISTRTALKNVLTPECFKKQSKRENL
ncbi:MAG: hypothetical protein KTV77_05320 [Wolbachia endosymbiont of Fragariocoptes setiger]|nr:hypothetical protein [Wolbachia endosymbiont of Fragariocoptes setiger]